MRLTLIISVLLLAACTGTKRGTADTKAKEYSEAETIKRIRAGNFQFETLNSNATFNLKSEMFSGSVSAKIRMIQDSVIWISASKLGFEVGRVMITKDSVFAVERLQKTYVKESIKELSTLAGFELDFETAQDLLVGNAYLHPVDNEVIYFDKDSIQIYPGYEEVKLAHTVRNGDFKLMRTVVIDESTKTNAVLDFKDYQEMEDGQLFSYFRNIFIDEENEVAITFKNTELNTEKAINFSIPPSYTPRKL